MEFRVGQTVVLIDNYNMVASLGATAVVTDVDTGKRYNMKLIDVEWKTNSNRQMNGGYEPYHFEPLLKKNEQLLFSFMKK